MPRQGRIQSGTGVYHVMMRGINRQRIFEDSEDHYTFLQCLRSAQEQYTPLGDRLPNSCHYYAYALMSNHFHILLHAKDDTVGNIVKRIASSYVYYFNRKYGRDGHLFKERFRSEPCEDWTYFVTLLRYIHQNPVKAGMVSRVSDYEFTSWHEYLGRADFFPLCNVNVVLGRISIDELTLAALLRRHAGVRQLQRLTGIGKNIISQDTGQVTGHCPELPPTSPTANRAHRAGGLQEIIKSLQWNAFFYWI